MTSLFIGICRVPSLMSRRSLPASSGAASMAHRLMWVRYSGALMPPLPISSMSGSCQCPGPAYCSWPACLSKPMVDMLFQLSSMSPLVRQRLPPTDAPNSHTFCKPYWHKLYTIGRACCPQCVAHFLVHGLHFRSRIDFQRAAPVVLQIIDAPGRPRLGILLLVLIAAFIVGARLGPWRRVVYRS